MHYNEWNNILNIFMVQKTAADLRAGARSNEAWPNSNTHVVVQWTAPLNVRDVTNTVSIVGKSYRIRHIFNTVDYIT